MADDDRKRNEVNEYLESDAGQWAVTIVAVLIGIGFAVNVVMSFTGWVQWLVAAGIVLAVAGAVWYFFFYDRGER